MRQRRRRCRPSLLPITALSLSTIALGTLLLWGVERPATNRVSPVAIRSSDVMDAPPVCLYQGLTGSMNPDAILTLVITPKSLSSHRNAVSEAKVRFAFRMMASLPDVNVVVLSRNCQVLLLAREMGLPTFQFTTGSDVEDLTYRHVLHVVDRVIPSTSPAVGFSNSDIIFDRSLGDTVRAALAHATSSGWRSWFLQGTRTNFDLPPENLDSLMSSWNAEHPPALKDIVAASGRTFHIDAQDYFIFNRGIELNWHCMPPFLLGGVYFGNRTGVPRARTDPPADTSLHRQLVRRACQHEARYGSDRWEPDDPGGPYCAWGASEGIACDVGVRDQSVAR